MGKIRSAAPRDVLIRNISSQITTLITAKIPEKVYSSYFVAPRRICHSHTPYLLPVMPIAYSTDFTVTFLKLWDALVRLNFAANVISLSESGKLCKIKDIKWLRNFLALF